MHHDSYFCFQIKEIRNNEIISFGSTDVPEQSTDVLSNIFINKHERGDTLFPANTKPNDNSITNKHSPGQKYEGGR
jgi:hypothetical protein